MVSFTPQLLYARERVAGTHCARSWVGTRTGLYVVENRYFAPPGVEPSFFGHQAHSLVNIPTTIYIYIYIYSDSYIVEYGTSVTNVFGLL